MPSYKTYSLTWVSLTSAWGISSQLLQQSAAAAPYLGGGVSHTAPPPDLERGVAPLSPPAPAQTLLLGGGVAPLGRHHWPLAWSSSSGPLLGCRSLALLVAAPDLGRGVAPHGQLLRGPTRGQTHIPHITRRILNHGFTREVLWTLNRSFIVYSLLMAKWNITFKGKIQYLF